MPILISFPSLSAALGDVVSSSDTITGFVIWAVSGVPLDPGSRLWRLSLSRDRVSNPYSGRIVRHQLRSLRDAQLGWDRPDDMERGCGAVPPGVSDATSFSSPPSPTECDLFSHALCCQPPHADSTIPAPPATSLRRPPLCPPRSSPPLPRSPVRRYRSPPTAASSIVSSISSVGGNTEIVSASATTASASSSAPSSAVPFTSFTSSVTSKASASASASTSGALASSIASFSTVSSVPSAPSATSSASTGTSGTNYRRTLVLWVVSRLRRYTVSLPIPALRRQIPPPAQSTPAQLGSWTEGVIR